MVPYTRGKEFSRSVEDIYAEVKTQVKNGAREITLLGQNVSSFRSSIHVSGKIKEIFLGKLCQILSKIEGLERIRDLTSHPIDINDELINEHKENQKMMPFLHLPIQSGSDKILKDMNRKHNKKFYLNLIDIIKKQVHNMAFSSDFIVGYPGETEQDFEETLDLIDKVKFASSYSFKYSIRPGTPSSIKKKIVDDRTASVRLKKIQEKLIFQQREFNLSFLDRTVEVLFSKVGKKDNQFVGRTPHLQPVHVCSKDNIIGKTLKVKINKLTSFSFHGKLIT